MEADFRAPGFRAAMLPDYTTVPTGRIVGGP